MLLLIVMVPGWHHLAYGQPSLADQLVGHWKFIGTEEFGVFIPPDSLQSNDQLVILADKTFQWTRAGQAVAGRITVLEAAKQVTFQDNRTNKSTTYRIKKLTEQECVLEFQTPDLVRTRLMFIANK